MTFEYQPIKITSSKSVKLAKHTFTKRRPRLNAAENFVFSFLEKILLGIEPSKLEIDEITYQTPVPTNYTENNTVRVRHYKSGSDSAVIVLPQSGYGLDFAKIIASYLAINGISAYEVETPLFGSRLPTGVRSMYQVVTSPDSLKLAFSQAITETRGLIDLVEEQKIGVCGVSLGAIYASILYGIDSRLSSACLLMGGGNIADMIFDSKEDYVARLRIKFERRGITRDLLREQLKDIEPRNYVNCAKSNNVLMINGITDEIVPFKHATDLAVSWGCAELYTLNTTHNGIIFKMHEALGIIVAHFERTLG